MKKKIVNIEDIYPLTIIKMRFGGKIVIFNAPSDAGFIVEVELNEDIFYNINEWLDENVSPCLYGIGDTLWDAFEDYKKRLYKY